MKLVKKRLPPFLFGLCLGLAFVYVYVKNREASKVRQGQPLTQQNSSLMQGRYSVDGSALPSLKNSCDIPVVRAGAEIPVTLLFEPGWKINKEAPTWLSLFAGDESKSPLIRLEKNTLIAEQGRLPAMQPGQRYQLQGTIYFCQDGKEAFCSIQSYDCPVRAEPAAERETIVLEVKQSA